MLDGPVTTIRRQLHGGFFAAPAPASIPARIAFPTSQDITMPLVSMRQLLDHAADNGYGIPAFNVNNLE